MLFGKLLPKEGNFFELFNRHAACIVSAALAFEQLVKNYADSHQREKFTQAVDDIENEADAITHQVNRLIHTTFITPIDREQIHHLISIMDDVADLLQDSAQTMTLYDIHHMTDEIHRLTDLAVQCCKQIQAAVALLEHVGKQEQADQALAICEHVDELEGDADQVMRSAVSRLFREEPDVRELIKLRAIYELLEQVTDRCEDVANQIEGIVLESS